MSTIKDVAKLANVSVTTVSRVINNNGYVHEDTRKIIRAAINELNYMPSVFAEGLSKGNVSTIGIIINDITSTTPSKLLEVIELACQKSNYKTIIAITRSSSSLEKYYYELFKKYNVSGIIVIDVPSSMEKFISLGKPIISINNYINDNISSISVNNCQGAKKAVIELLNNDCNNILIIKFKTDLDKVNPLIDELNNEKINFNVLELDKINKDIISQFLNDNIGFDAIYATSDLLAISVISLLQKMNISIPDDCCVIGYDNSSFANLISPSLSSIDFPVEELGNKAFDLLHSHITNDINTSVHEVIDIELIIRESTSRNIKIVT